MLARGTRQQQGLTLIESVVTLLVLSVGVLSAAVLQLKATHYSILGQQRSIATIQAYDLESRLIANRCRLDVDLADIKNDWIAQWGSDSRVPWTGNVDVTRSLQSGNLYEYKIFIEWINTQIPAAIGGGVVTYEYTPLIEDCP